MRLRALLAACFRVLRRARFRSSFHTRSGNRETCAKACVKCWDQKRPDRGGGGAGAMLLAAEERAKLWLSLSLLMESQSLQTAARPHPRKPPLSSALVPRRIHREESRSIGYPCGLLRTCGEGKGRGKRGGKLKKDCCD